MLNRRPYVTPAFIALALLSCASPKSANPAQGPVGVSTPGPAAQGRQADAPLTFAIDLRDGSRIVGTPLVTGLVIETSFGPIAFRLEQVASILIPDSVKGARVMFRNGDILQGSLQADSIPVQFAPGKMNLPVTAILRISSISGKEDLARGLVAHYPLRGNTADVTGHGHDAVNHGALPAPDRFGKEGQAYEFDGIGAHIRLSEGIIDPNGPACTLSLWALTRSSRTFRYALYIGAATGEIALLTEDGQFKFGPGLPDRRRHEVSSPALENVFVHLAGVYVRGKSIRLYVNGEQKSEAPLPDLPLNSGLMEYSSAIGAYAPEHPEHAQRFGASNWLGRIGDVRIYDRVLSDDEIRSLARARE